MYVYIKKIQKILLWKKFGSGWGVAAETNINFPYFDFLILFFCDNSDYVPTILEI